MNLEQIYKQAAIAAKKDNIDPGDEDMLISWIENNCKYDSEHLFFIVLGIGSELADLLAQEKGFKNEVHRAFEHAMSIGDKREKHIKWLKYHI